MMKTIVTQHYIGQTPAPLGLGRVIETRFDDGSADYRVDWNDADGYIRTEFYEMCPPLVRVIYPPQALPDAPPIPQSLLNEIDALFFTSGTAT